MTTTTGTHCLSPIDWGKPCGKPRPCPTHLSEPRPAVTAQADRDRLMAEARRLDALTPGSTMCADLLAADFAAEDAGRYRCAADGCAAEAVVRRAGVLRCKAHDTAHMHEVYAGGGVPSVGTRV